jgi:MFS family permease
MHTVGNLRAVARSADFRRLLSVRLVNQVADGVFQASLAGSVFFNPDRQADPVAIALGFAVLLLPYSFVGPFAGVVLDRVRRRHVLVLANVVRACLLPFVAMLMWVGQESAPFLLLALVTISVNRFFLSGVSASLPHVVATDRLVTANSIATTLGTVCYAVGSALSVALLAIPGRTNHGYAVIGSVSLVGYLASAYLARGFPPDRLGPDAATRARHAGFVAVVRGMAQGARHVTSRRGAAYALLAVSGHRLLYGMLMMMSLLLYRNYFRPGPVFMSGLGGLGQVVASGALGALVAAAITPWAVRHMRPWRWIAGMLVLAAIVEVTLGLPYRKETVVAAAFGLGLTAQGIKIVTDTAVQTQCADEFQGRVFSVYDTMFNIALVGGLLVASLALPVTGRSPAVLAAVAAAFALAGLAYGLAASDWDRRRPSVPRTLPAATPVAG